MATLLNKPIKRQMLSTEQQGKYKHRPIIVELLPGDEIAFRIKGTKKAFSIYLGHCYRLAQMQQAENDFRIAMQNYTAKKAAGKKVRKPHRPNLPFNKIYYKAIN